MTTVEMKMMNRKDILKELLFVFDDICKANDLKYSVVGNVAKIVTGIEGASDDFENITVAMTGGDIEKLIAIVNSKEQYRYQVEYILNNPFARGLQIRFYDKDTTSINIKEFGNHIFYGFFIRIQPIERVVENKMSAKLLKFFKQAWKGSSKRIEACNYKRIVPVVLLKTVRKIIGRERVAKLLYNYNRKLKCIENWEEISKYDTVRIGSAFFINEFDWEIKEYFWGNKQVSVCSLVLNRRTSKEITKANIDLNFIEEFNTPFSEVLSEDIKKDLYKMQKERDVYLRIVTKANGAANIMKHAWQTYLMIHDVIEFDEMYSEEVITNIQNAIDENNYDDYIEKMGPYLISRRKWRRAKIPFIVNSDLEDVILRAEEVF